MLHHIDCELLKYTTQLRFLQSDIDRLNERKWDALSERSRCESTIKQLTDDYEGTKTGGVPLRNPAEVFRTNATLFRQEIEIYRSRMAELEKLVETISGKIRDAASKSTEELPGKSPTVFSRSCNVIFNTVKVLEQNDLLKIYDALLKIYDAVNSGQKVVQCHPSNGDRRIAAVILNLCHSVPTETALGGLRPELDIEQELSLVYDIFNTASDRSIRIPSEIIDMGRTQRRCGLYFVLHEMLQRNMFTLPMGRG